MLNTHQTNSGERLSFYKLFHQKGYKIEIPIIQRDYAQGRESTTTIRNSFISALKYYLLDDQPNRDLDFVYGSLLNGKGGSDIRFVPLDGQQRLTTLFLLHWYLAIKEGFIDDFRQTFATQKNNGEWESKFTYETRSSAREFCNALAGSEIEPDSLMESDTGNHFNLSGALENQQWYFLSWENDPTIQGMLVMLDTIHSEFGADEISFYPKLTSLDDPVITFQFLKLEEFGLTDDLYIKMNARGKPLTSFENFKAKLEQHIKQAPFNSKAYKLRNRKELTVQEYFSHKIDGGWANLIWSYIKDDSESTSLDDAMLNLIKTYGVNYISSKKNADSAVRELILSENERISVTQFQKVNGFEQQSVEGLITLLDILENGDKRATQFIPKYFYYDESVFEDFLKNRNFIGAGYAKRILFHAYCQYLITWSSESTFSDTEGLKEWMRIIHNLSDNTAPYNNAREFISSIKGINKVLVHSNKILDFLREGGTLSGFDHYQIREEKIKALLIEKGSRWESLIMRAEQHGYFKGQIGFLLRFCGVEDYFKENLSCNWTETEDQYYRDKFLEYFQRSCAIFDKDGLKDEISSNGQFIWERALLAKGDYLISEGRNRSFLINSDRDISWKRLLKGDKNEVPTLFLKDIFDALDIQDIPGSLEKIKDSYRGDSWRRKFIETPKLLKYLDGKRYVRPNSNHGFVLFQGERMTKAHPELYSLSFFYEHLENEEIPPFMSSSYYYAKGEDKLDSPCAYLDGWKEKPYALDIRFITEKTYEIRFFSRKDEELETWVVKILNNLGMMENDKYGDTSFLIEFETEGETLSFIKELCLQLKNSQYV